MSVRGGEWPMPKITVGLTTYNAESFLEGSIRSLLAQTERDFELVISDDQSQDRTDTICRKWAARDSRITYVRQEKNLGPRGNFEYVFSRRKEDYFMWASHDDLWSPSYIESCIADLDANKDAGFAITRWVVESRTFPLIRRMFLPSMRFVTNPDPKKRMLKFTSLPFTSFKDTMTYGVWRRDALSRVLNDLSGRTRYFSIGGAANEYTLLLYRGCFVDGPCLRKRYRYVPPGSFLEPVVSAVSRIKRGAIRTELYSRYTRDDHIQDLLTVFKLAGLDQATIELALSYA
jgi:glycosyltransferase involved in cell wall biosynthesis